MKIATWNIDRVKSKRNLISIIDNIQTINADILILTEYNKIVELPFYDFNIETKELPKEPYNYNKKERRVSIFSKFPITEVFKTYDDLTCCCAQFETSLGKLIVYGTIVGIVGIPDKNFNSDLEKQIREINLLAKFGDFCYSGDLNMSFSDNYYFTKNGRQSFNECFKENKLENATKGLEKNIDHIIITKKFLNQYKVKILEWNTDKKLSDHKGICIELIS